ncbi:MAG: NrdH-redoxin [Chloroflexi bacterium]|uniref:NrdH-redoxin n=1 Tax=Candidatus Chlorohelix allophototropha TaxID=3003348 RepID=A0A8T7M860_9CHLR|nr:NrdH-redoxin [Chloroflexota bacterium]WJW68272.1 NrdH-redoxin [Chloroflexota bacterium L227-S17]
MNSNDKVLLYGAMWCGDCRRSKKFLDERQVAYSWIDVESDETAMQEMQQLNGGRQSIPTILLPDGKILIEPTNRDLAVALGLGKVA